MTTMDVGTQCQDEQQPQMEASWPSAGGNETEEALRRGLHGENLSEA